MPLILHKGAKPLTETSIRKQHRAGARRNWIDARHYQNALSIDRPFIVLTETKPSKRHIPVWARYSPLRTRVEAHASVRTRGMNEWVYVLTIEALIFGLVALTMTSPEHW